MDNPPNSFMAENANAEDEFISKTIYVGDLSSEITEKEVTEYFLKFGSIASVTIKRKRSERGPWSHAFVTFEKSELAAKALALAKHEILSRRVVVKAADGWDQPKEKDSECKRNEVSILHLNYDCLKHIAWFLELRDFFHLSKTCKLLECYLEPIFASYKKLDTDSLRGLTLKQIREVLCKIGPHLQHIVCSANFEELLKKFCVAENIVSLDCPDCCLSKELLKTFKNLEELKCRITDDMVAVLSNCKNLQNLDLCFSLHLTGKHLDKLSNLQHLNLKGSSNLEPEFFKNLCMKTKLVSLNIQGCLFLDYSSFATLAITQTQLETLSIDIGYTNSSPLATLKSLKRLRISCFYPNCDEFFQELAKHRGADLEVLEIWRCQFNQKVEQAIYSLKKLKALVVIDCRNITSMFLTKLAITPLECLVIHTFNSTLDEGVLNLISKSETIKVIFGNNINIQHNMEHKYRELRRLVLRANEIMKKKERKYPLSLFTIGPCIIDGIHHEELYLLRREYRKIIKKLGYLGPTPEWFDFHNYLMF